MKNFKKSTFLFKVDDSGREYVEMSFNEATKNHPNAESLNIKTRMYSHNELDNCPIKSLRKYLSKLDEKCDTFFTIPKRAYKEAEKWYTIRPMGVNSLSGLMINISTRLGLSQRYTNHSIRATTVTQLSRAGFQARQIMRVTGHKVESSLTSYSADNSENEKRIISDTLMRPAPTNASSTSSITTTCAHTHGQSSTSVSDQQIQNIFYNYNCKIEVIQNKLD